MSAMCSRIFLAHFQVADLASRLKCVVYPHRFTSRQQFNLILDLAMEHKEANVYSDMLIGVSSSPRPTTYAVSRTLLTTWLYRSLVSVLRAERVGIEKTALPVMAKQS